jgi:hypothetical protein
MDETPFTGGFRLRVAAAFFTLGAAIIHFAVVPEHLVTYVPYGVFLFLVGLAQLGLVAGLLLRPSSGLLLAAGAGTLLVIAIWIASRTVGIPVGPDSELAEPIGLPDLFTSLMEYVAVVLMLLAERRLKRSTSLVMARRMIPGLFVAGLAALTLTSIGLAGVVAAGGH